MSTHTKAPWRWFLTDQGVDLRTPDRGQLLIMDAVKTKGGIALRFAKRSDDMGGLMKLVHDLITSPHKRPGFVDIDNPDARLIQAAPELLEACEKIVAACELTDDKYFDAIDMAINVVRAAIAKAKGGAA